MSGLVFCVKLGLPVSEIIHLAADNEAQSVLIVTAALNVYFIQLKTREQCRDNFAYTSISPESESYSVSSCFYEVNHPSHHTFHATRNLL